MCCLLALLAAISPRLALLLVWIFTPEVDQAFRGGLVAPLIGLVFLPLTTLAYALVYNPAMGVTGAGWLLVVLGLLLDLGAYGGGARSRRRYG
jgi:hypothetical protein